MSFQTRKTFVHLRNTNLDVFDEIESSQTIGIGSNATAIFPGPET